MISIKQKGDFKRTEKFLVFLKTGSLYRNLEQYAQEGVDALRNATPIDTGETANSWYYNISIQHGAVTIEWANSNLTDQGTPVAILLQYGHGTGTGGYVQGQDFINPAIRPVFDNIAKSVWREVSNA